MDASNQKIILSPVLKIGEDERGSTHIFNTDRFGEFIIGYRKAGSANGRHYHKGRAEYKRPEIIIIMQGEARVNWMDMNDGSKGFVMATAPVMVSIQPWVWHELVVIKDMVVLELNALADGQGDTFRLED
jgi:dTDP-4-dehydrorhamnose 3,5-epimerase-like enzyme